MTLDQIKKLRMYYHSLVGQKKGLDEAANESGQVGIEGPQFQVIADELHRVEKDFPGFLPVFNADQFFQGRDNLGGSYYSINGLKSYLTAALGRLKVEIDTCDSIPVTQTRDFSFVKDAEVRKIIERDYLEIQRAFLAQCWKSVIILAGSAMEANLVRFTTTKSKCRNCCH